MNARAVLRSEWTKVGTLPWLWALPVGGVVTSIAASLMVCAAYGNVQDLFVRDPSLAVYYGLYFGQLAFVCFGVLLIGQEYNSGTIRGSLTAVPRRGLLYGSKLALGAGVGLAAGLACSAGCLLVGRATLWRAHVVWSDPAPVRGVVACALYPALLMVFCLGATTMLRNLTAAMGLLVPAIFLGTNLLSGVPGARAVVQFLPDRAGQYAMRFADDPHTVYGHWTGLAVMALWAAAAAYGGLRTLRGRDA
ncbi:ABC transporter permease [Kitasatospora sp. NBC_01287]|uniref:ABC transporter permease n=1 Tax=Kitasatospora sp. NBC_01287 TaxID=2903573 RepID=UPI0022575839|nr:ABC transporter permease [Kitasatospora sp. NBC_01287]MCX4747979.1 ABC transporter permease [Kitasatospora sp. NBC_01287]